MKVYVVFRHYGGSDTLLGVFATLDSALCSVDASWRWTNGGWTGRSNYQTYASDTEWWTADTREVQGCQ
jgi:hypothetical protein